MDEDVVFTLVGAYETILSELIVELVRNRSLRSRQALKILLRAESVTDLIPPDDDETPNHHQERLQIRRVVIDEILQSVVKRLGVQPDVGVLRRRRKMVADEYRRRPHRRKRRKCNRDD